jgi:hypothetical protein
MGSSRFLEGSVGAILGSWGRLHLLFLEPQTSRDLKSRTARSKEMATPLIHSIFDTNLRGCASGSYPRRWHTSPWEDQTLPHKRTLSHRLRVASEEVLAMQPEKPGKF